jgi:Domain of unknown function (DUF3859)
MRAIVSYFVLVMFSSIAHAQTAQIERIDIAGKGIYKVDAGQLTPDKRTPTGVVTIVENAAKIEDTITIPARNGLEFGIQYVIVGLPKSAKVPIRIVNVYPKQGLRNPETHKVIRRAEIVRDKFIGDVNYTGYAFENEWEMVPGIWKFELWHKNRKLAEQSFTVTRP